MVHFGDRIQHLVTAIDAIREDVPELGKGGAERFQQWHCTVIVLNIDGMDLNCNDVSLAPFQSLCRIKSTRSAILTVDVTCIVQAITPILFARDFGPRHVVLPR